MAIYLVEQKMEEPNHFRQLGVVVANSVQEAASKLGAQIVDMGYPPESMAVCARLERGYWLIEQDEVKFLP